MVFKYGFSKLQIDDIDFQKDHFSYQELIKTKTVEALQTISEPSKQTIYLVLLLQCILLLLIWSLSF